MITRPKCWVFLSSSPGRTYSHIADPGRVVCEPLTEQAANRMVEGLRVRFHRRCSAHFFHRQHHGVVDLPFPALQYQGDHAVVFIRFHGTGLLVSVS